MQQQQGSFLDEVVSKSNRHITGLSNRTAGRLWSQLLSQ